MFNAVDRKGNVVVFTHRPPWSEKKNAEIGCYFDRNPDIKVNTEHMFKSRPIEDARKAMEDHDCKPRAWSIQAVWAGWYEPAIGATQAIIAR